MLTKAFVIYGWHKYMCIFSILFVLLLLAPTSLPSSTLTPLFNKHGEEPSLRLFVNLWEGFLKELNPFQKEVH